MNTVRHPIASSSSPKVVGCATCRIRRKKCPIDLDAQGACSLCQRLGLVCWGYGQPLPPWTKDGQALQNYKKQLHTAVVLHRQRSSYETHVFMDSYKTSDEGQQEPSAFLTSEASIPEDFGDLDMNTQDIPELAGIFDHSMPLFGPSYGPGMPSALYVTAEPAGSNELCSGSISPKP